MTNTPLDTAPNTTDHRAVALEVLERLETAWNEADGEAFGDNYAPDASFVTIRGERVVGRAAIAAGHAAIFSTIYAGSVNRMELLRVTEIAEGALLVSSLSTLDCPCGPLVGVHRAMSTNVITTAVDNMGRPLIVSTHNTLVQA